MIISKNNLIVITQPSPFDFVGASFIVAGTVEKRLLESPEGNDYRLSLDLLDHIGKGIMGSSISLLSNEEEATTALHFQLNFCFHSGQYSFLERSQGYMTLCISEMRKGFLDNDREEVYIPVIIKQFIKNTPETKIIAELHRTTSERIQQYRKDTQEYHRELQAIEERKNNFYLKAIGDVGKEYINAQDEYFLDKLYFEIEGNWDDERRDLDEKYKDSIEWTGPLLKGLAGRLNGFHFRVYSNDHDKHFHVIHKEREIDARFSFPELELLNYKGRSNTISRKDVERIHDFFKVEENFEKLKNEFERRDMGNNFL